MNSKQARPSSPYDFAPAGADGMSAFAQSRAEQSRGNTVLLAVCSEDCCLPRAVAKHGTSAIQALLGRASNPLIRKPVSLRLLHRYFRIREAFFTLIFPDFELKST